MTTGDSGTPLAKKLGIKEDFTVYAVNAPDDLDELLSPLPPGVTMLAGRNLGQTSFTFLQTAATSFLGN